MTIAKLTGSLLVYKDLPPAAPPQPESPMTNVAGDLRRVDRGQAAELAPPREHGPMIRFAFVGCIIAAVATAGLVCFIHTGAQIATPAATRGTPVSASASTAEEEAADRIAGSPSAPVAAAPAELIAIPQPIPERSTAAAEDAQAAIPAAPTAPGAVATIVEPPAPLRQPAADAQLLRAEANLPAEQLTALVLRGDRLFGAGDITSARLFYQRAAEAGDARAALQLAESYDAVFLYRAGLTTARGDPAAAVQWYQRARQLGAADAEILLKNLASAGAEAVSGK